MEVETQIERERITQTSDSEEGSSRGEMLWWVKQSPEWKGVRSTSPPDRPAMEAIDRPSTPRNPSPDIASTDRTEEDRSRAREACWNCESPSHFAYECPLPRRPGFCFRCGQKGYTVRTCPECGAAWRLEGPYKEGKGHDLGQEAPRRRGPPPGTPRY
ncbi:DNA-binding protein HEXBP-like [Temnothorax curvispinosus]|uniref:DNA-binding protein HEXBP-like n=1 Tax=Temnothorax curvispinosus TaxID=300111 RepID=A0A6J1R506_9HYME|nr:DNA-binding protein HEXBP-like [Temnothorax curvispinosus]